MKGSVLAAMPAFLAAASVCAFAQSEAALPEIRAASVRLQEYAAAERAADRDAAGPRQEAFERIAATLARGGPIAPGDKPLLDRWFAPFLQASMIGRAPTPAERAEMGKDLPGLLQQNDWRVTGDSDPKYNCVAWSVGYAGWISPSTLSEVPAAATEADRAAAPAAAEAAVSNQPRSGLKDPQPTTSEFDAFFKRHGLVPMKAGESAADADVALWANAARWTHASRHIAGEWWESKIGVYARIVHRIPELEGSYYGRPVRLYRRGRPEELN